MSDPLVMAFDPVEISIGKLCLCEGDVLVVKVDRHLSGEAMMRVHQHMRHTLGGANKILVLDSSIELSVLTREEIEARLANA